MVLAEAMAAGTPIVASRIAGYHEVVVDGGEGILVPPGDALALSEALGRVIGDVDLGRELGRRGQLKAPRFAWPAVVTRILSTYNAAITQIQEDTGRHRGNRYTTNGPGETARTTGRSIVLDGKE